MKISGLKILIIAMTFTVASVGTVATVKVIRDKRAESENVADVETIDESAIDEEKENRILPEIEPIDDKRVEEASGVELEEASLEDEQNSDDIEKDNNKKDSDKVNPGQIILPEQIIISENLKAKNLAASVDLDDTESSSTPINSDYVLVPKDDEPETPKTEAVYADHANSVSSAMCKADYWAAKSENADKLLASANTIKELNRSFLESRDTNMNDLLSIPEASTFNATNLKNKLANVATPNKCNYIDGQVMADKEAYYSAMRENIANASTSDNATNTFVICVKRADMKSWPTNDVIGNSVGDADDEIQLAALIVNEPAVAKLTTADGKFTYVLSSNCSGWVASECLAICRDKNEWIQAWNATDNFIVVTTDRIVLEPSIKTAKSSKVELDLSCKLNLVPEENISLPIGERGRWNNYVVYIPTRDENGYYEKTVALISQHHKISVGYLPLTERNLLSVAFECLGNRYGWGGMLKSMDCSMYTRNIYRCCGLELPRNTNWQASIPTTNYKVEGKSREEKMELLNTLPAGTLLKFSGHITMYLGHENINGVEKYYVISDLGSVYREEETGIDTILSEYSVVINTLDVRRRGKASDESRTWLSHMTDFICPWAYAIEENINDEQIYVANDLDNIPKGNLTYADSVSDAMCKAEYWINKSENADRLLMDKDQIKALNQEMLAANTGMHDLINMSLTYNAISLRDSLASASTPATNKCGYINGQAIADKEAYYESMRANIRSAEATENAQIKYALCVKRADIKDWPTSDIIGHSAGDADDEIQSAALIVNEPAIAKLKTSDGEFTYIISSNCSGWVPTKCLAICNTKEEWLQAWNADDNFIVVTTDEIVLEPSIKEPSTSEVELSISCKLNLVPEEEYKNSSESLFGERGTWNNYVVYIPTRDENGMYVKKMALISEHHKVSVGYLPLTERSLISVAFECLGNRYGWGGMLESMDCSMYTRNIYRCCGVELPRNTTGQTRLSNGLYDVSSYSNDEKKALLNTLPAGTLLMFSGHITMYLGHENIEGIEKYYVISALGSVYGEGENPTYYKEYNVVINSLDVQRGGAKNGDRTWMSHMIYFVCPWVK